MEHPVKLPHRKIMKPGQRLGNGVRKLTEVFL